MPITMNQKGSTFSTAVFGPSMQDKLAMSRDSQNGGRAKSASDANLLTSCNPSRDSHF